MTSRISQSVPSFEMTALDVRVGACDGVAAMGRAAANKRVSENQSEAAVRERLLNSAINIFTQRGYAAATVREIVEAAGVTKPVLYYYFGNKEGIYLEIMKEALAQFKALLDESEKLGGRAWDRIQNLCARCYELAHENLKVVRLIHSIFYGPSQSAPQCFAPEAFHDLFHEAMLRLIREGIRTGDFARHDDEAMAHAVGGAFGTAIELEMAAPERAIGRRGLQQVLDVIFEGIRGPHSRSRENRKR
ncbi:MAG: TetR/AcrR family transcriptional regulator [Thermodesulfobacteriota bacterium]